MIDEVTGALGGVLPYKYNMFYHVSVEKKGYSGVAVFSKVCGGKWDLVEGPRYGIPP